MRSRARRWAVLWIAVPLLGNGCPHDWDWRSDAGAEAPADGPRDPAGEDRGPADGPAEAEVAERPDAPRDVPAGDARDPPGDASEARDAPGDAPARDLAEAPDDRVVAEPVDRPPDCGPDGCPPCTAETCPDGCCEGLRCRVGLADQCGRAGAACRACADGEACIDGACAVLPAGMAAVAGGTFTMGCNTSPAGECQDNERPAHSVTVPAFEIDRTEVTVAAWQVWHAADPVPDRTPGTTAGCTWRVVSGQNLPINCVTWIQARSYCYSLDKRLCSEAEWEFAARGGGTRKYPWGDEPPACERAHYLGCAPDRPVQVARHPATANGLWDMAGNVREWVDDDWHGTYDRAPADGSSWHGSPRDTGDRTIRGGHYAGGASGLRATVRMGMMYGAGGAFLGVRCCRSGK